MNFLLPQVFLSTQSTQFTPHRGSNPHGLDRQANNHSPVIKTQIKCLPIRDLTYIKPLKLSETDKIRHDWKKLYLKLSDILLFNNSKIKKN